MKKLIGKLITYFVLWYIVFNFAFTLTEIIILRIYGLEKNFFDILYENFKNNIILFLIVYIFVLIVINLHDKIVIQELNQKLKRLKERRKNDE